MMHNAVPGAFSDKQLPRLLLVVNVSWYFISHRLVLAKAARLAGYDVHVATRIDKLADAECIQKAGLKLHHIEIGRGDSGVFYDLHSFWRLCCLYRKVRPDIVHHVGLKPVVFGGVASQIWGVRSVVQAISGLGYTFASGGVLSRFRQKMMTLAIRAACWRTGTVVILQNVDDVEALVAARVIRRKQVILIRGSGVAVGEVPMQSEPEGIVRVVLPARMLREKGVGEFVEAAKELHKSGVKAEFLLAGSLDYRNPGSISSEQLKHWESSNAVKYLGFIENIIDLFISCHIICLPSYYREGVPKALIEAAACGRPIVTANRPGCRDIVRDGVNGLLVPVRDARALTVALRRLIEDADLRRRYGQAGRELAAAEFDLGIVLEQTLAVYKTLLHGDEHAQHVARLLHKGKIHEEEK